ncbi:hypothetical protein B0T26DRAFT_686842 [Lasiosphaeria miniovina]|uniref:Uncharacterized protein n=1 Tax=Lasiosphaeria miniovina TaxID=1954250 RepID=A0AA40BGY8_9PEZI|nr:uncharacterized protein B0T26DRAFT_686842 [Lasiosphaeria miniovina]KAK0734036.1 hypothetical protein B0T26DRAFT_686842 [Lasiosphaeria miniovina]
MLVRLCCSSAIPLFLSISSCPSLLELCNSACPFFLVFFLSFSSNSSCPSLLLTLPILLFLQLFLNSVALLVLFFLSFSSCPSLLVLLL